MPYRLFYDIIPQIVTDLERSATLSSTPLTTLSSLDPLLETLNDTSHPKEAQILSEVTTLCLKSPDHGGLGLTSSDTLSPTQTQEVTFLISAWLEAQNSSDRAKPSLPPLTTRPSGRRPMTLTEKIFAQHDVQRRGFVAPGMTLSVSVDWILASDASWGGMERTYRSLNSPGIFRNDRFWLALDHVVDPRINHRPEVAKLIEQGEKARDMFKMTDFQGQNYTILHTEFYRQRAEPGMIAIGSDSHTCSSGALGLLSIGLGAADVTMALVTGEIWFKVPEVAEIRFEGQPPLGISGKDVILYILQQLKRNTVAADRVVEYTGPGLKYLSCDARFAIANMTTVSQQELHSLASTCLLPRILTDTVQEFGGITGIFVPDSTTHSFINSRKSPRNKSSSIYFQPDPDATYASSHTIDLSLVKPFIAVYPNPDDVVSVTEFAGKELDGVFIGACTTAEEDIILGALVLEQGLKNGLKPVGKGKRKVTPGSKPIVKKLEETGLADVYRAAGFEIGIPGCSYCVGMSADKAGEGEVWLSSQNRNFENRMGKGSIGNLASAATVAASSFEMVATDPTELIGQIDMKRWDSLKKPAAGVEENSETLTYVEPNGEVEEEVEVAPAEHGEQDATEVSKSTGRSDSYIVGKIQVLGDMIDTDAVSLTFDSLLRLLRDS